MIEHCAAELHNEDVITFKQWKHTDRTGLDSDDKPIGDFIDEFVKQLDELTSHHYIAEAQAAYLRDQKELLPQHTVICLLDFGENFSYIVQDAIQGHYWNNKGYPCFNPIIPAAIFGGHSDPVSTAIIKVSCLCVCMHAYKSTVVFVHTWGAISILSQGRVHFAATGRARCLSKGVRASLERKWKQVDCKCLTTFKRN